MKKKHIVNIIIALILLIGLCVLLYPVVAAYFNDRRQTRVVTSALEEVAALDPEDMQEFIDAAREYNAALLGKQRRFRLSAEDWAEYNALLNIGSGVMGILVIDKIDVKLPIYHGTEAAVLQIGLGHIPGSSLPVGGTGTHAFITGHTGLPSTTLLTRLDRMAVGDSFVIHVMGETLTYEVDKIEVVLPHEVESLKIDPDMDYCTLVTCTPYGINSHRLLVRGRRIENMAEASVYGADAVQVDKYRIILIFIVPVLPLLAIYIILKSRRIIKGGVIQ